MAGYEGTWYRRGFGAGYSPKDGKWPQGNGYGKRYGTKEKKRTDKSYRQNGTQSQTTIPPKNQERMVNISQQKVPVTDKMGMGEIKTGMIEGNLEIPNMTLKIKMRKVIQKIPVS